MAGLTHFWRTARSCGPTGARFSSGFFDAAAEPPRGTRRGRANLRPTPQEDPAGVSARSESGFFEVLLCESLWYRSPVRVAGMPDRGNMRPDGRTGGYRGNASVIVFGRNQT